MDDDDLFTDEPVSENKPETGRGYSAVLNENPDTEREDRDAEIRKLEEKPPIPIWKEFSEADKPQERPASVQTRQPVQAASGTASSNVVVLSHSGDPDNKFLAPIEIREFVVFLSDGRLYISRDHASQGSVSYYVRKISELFLRIYNRSIRKEIVPFDELRQIAASKIGRTQIRAVENIVQQRITNIIIEAVKHQATDLHWIIAGSTTRMLTRINGELHETGSLSYIEGLEMAGAVYGAMLQNSDTSFKKDAWQEGQWKSEMLPPGLSNIRESHRPIVGGLTMKLRLQHKNLKGIQTLDDMGYSRAHILMFDYMLLKSSGIFLVSGPMGSAKTTSLSILLARIKKENPGWCVTSLEDPPEYDIEGVEQSKPPHEQGFAGGLKKLLRQDADVMMVGEIRDTETAQVALETALTGHPIWSTIHAKSALYVFPRLEEMGVSKAKIYDHNLIGGVVAQRLIPKLCPHCKDPVSAVPGNSQWLKKLELVGIDPGNVFMPNHNGCSRCYKGHRGATIVAEVIIPDAELMEFGFAGDIIGQARYLKEIGNKTMMDHALSKIAEGMISPEDVQVGVGPIGEDDSKKTRNTMERIAGILGRAI